MGFKPTRAVCIGRANQHFNHSGATLSEQRNKENASLQIEYFFLLKIKNLSNQAPVRSKKDLTSVYLKCDDEISTLVLEQD